MVFFGVVLSIFVRGGTSIYYEEYGKGFPVLLIAPGGMKSALQAWSMAPWNPIEVLKDSFHVIAMDQRNAGQSTGTVHQDDGWHTYSDDQLGLMDHLDIDRFMVAGMCIGGPYIFSLLKKTEDRIKACVIFQSIGRDNNRNEFYSMFDNWADDILADRPEVSEAELSGFRENMFGGDKKLFSIEDEFLTQCKTPMCILMGNDLYHPESASRFISQQARESIFIEHWKEGVAADTAKNQVLDFLSAFSSK